MPRVDLEVHGWPGLHGDLLQHRCLGQTVGRAHVEAGQCSSLSRIGYDLLGALRPRDLRIAERVRVKLLRQHGQPVDLLLVKRNYREFTHAEEAQEVGRDLPHRRKAE